MIIYYINLELRKDRKKFFENQFHNSGLYPNRIPAISLTEENRNLAPLSVASCWLSHQLTFKKFLETDESHALIFEDDAIVETELLELIRKIDKTDLTEIDLFQLGYLKDSNRILVDSGKIDILYRWKVSFTSFLKQQTSRIVNIIDPKILKGNVKFLSTSNIDNLRNSLGIRNPLLNDSFEAGAHCYIISRKLALDLVEFNAIPVILSADLLLIEVANSKKYKSIRVSRSLCFQKSELGSNIILRSTKNILQPTKGLK